MSHYNLIDEKWIPIRFHDGKRDELGILDTLLRSKEIAVIEDPSPLVVAALHRFLLAVLYRSLEGPTDIDQARVLFKEGLPGEKIKAYLELWRHRFWLFDEQYPFYQIPSYEPQEKNGKKQWRSWPAIAAEHNADNAKVLFDHTEISSAGSIPTSKAIQWLLACQTFSLGGGNSDFRYTKGAPSANAIIALPIGINLQDTLLFSLIPEGKEVLASDRPIWEQTPLSLDELKSGNPRPLMGVADLYTWLTRSIKLNPHENGMTLTELAFSSGAECTSENFIDPMLAYWVGEKAGKQPHKFEEKGVWRDFDSLLPDASNLGPKVIEHANKLAGKNIARHPHSVMVLGQANSKAKIEYWRMEKFSWPESLGENNLVRTEIHQLLAEAEATSKKMEGALIDMAKLTLAKGARKLQEDKWSAGKWKPGDASKFIGKSSLESTPVALTVYWSILEPKFHETLQEYTLNSSSDYIRKKWLESVRDALKHAWDQHCTSASMRNAWTIRALVKAEGAVLKQLKKLNEEILNLGSHMEGT